MNRFTPGKILTTGVAIISIALLSVFFISLRQSQRVNNTSELVNHTQEVIKHIQQLVMASLDNETGARGYVISGKDHFLEPLQHSVKQFKNELTVLDSLLSDNPIQKKSMDSLEQYIRLRLMYSDSMVAARKRTMEDAVLLVESGVGKIYTDRIRELGSGMIAVESELLEKRKAANSSTISNLNFLLYTLLSAVFLMSLFVIQRVQNDIKQREASENRFRALLQAAPDATIIADEKGIIRMINRQAELLLNYTPTELLEQPVEILIPPNLHTAHVHHRNGFIRSSSLRAMGAGLELYAVKKGGAEFPVEISLSPIKTDEGLMVIASIRDITQRKKLESSLRRSNSELEAFTYSVSHDLRAPLRGIVGFTSILEEDYADKLDDEGKRVMSVIKANTLKMANLIDDLLAFSRLGRQEINKAEVDTEALVKDIVQDISRNSQYPNLQWQIEELPDCSADLTTIRQVWINLISNAVKYSSKEENPVIHIGHTTDKGEQVFFVKDNGVGFDMKYRDKLFGVFQRLHSEEDFEGTGVGLALVDKIIARHGGRVWAESKVGEGASFYFTLPLK